MRTMAGSVWGGQYGTDPEIQGLSASSAAAIPLLAASGKVPPVIQLFVRGRQ